jgi:tetratricopeptide (TPR) repeat protein
MCGIIGPERSAAMKDEEKSGEAILRFVAKAVRMNLEDVGNEGDLPDSYFALAREVGLAEDDLTALVKRGRDHYTRAREYAEQQIPREALRECHKAIEIMPWDYSLMLFAADLALNTGITNRQNDMLDEAIRLSRLIVEHHPDCGEAYNIISQAESFGGKAKSYILPIVIAVIVLLIFGGSTALLFMAPMGEPTVVPSVTKESGAAVEPLQIPNEPDSPRVVAFSRINNVYDNSLVLRERSGNVSNYESKYLQLNFELENTGRRAVTAFTLGVDLFDAGGNLLRRDELLVISSAKPALYPKEKRVFRYIKKVPELYHSYTVEVTNLVITPAPVSAPRTFPIDVAVRVSPEDRLLAAALSYKARRTDLSHYATSSYLKLDIEVANNGADILELVKFEISFFDGEGNLLDSKGRYLVATLDPQFLPGEMRIFSNTIAMPLEAVRWEMAIIEIDNLL